MGLGKVLHAGPVKGEVGEDESFGASLFLVRAYGETVYGDV